jgi:hypothetical protein
MVKKMASLREGDGTLLDNCWHSVHHESRRDSKPPRSSRSNLLQSRGRLADRQGRTGPNERWTRSKDEHPPPAPGNRDSVLVLRW